MPSRSEGRKEQGKPEQALVTLGAILILAILMILVTVLISPGLQELRFSESLDSAQVARNLSRGEGFTTSVARPLQLRQYPQATWPLPDLSLPPLFPCVLSMVLRVMETNDKTVAVTSSLFLVFLLVALLVWGNRTGGLVTACLATLMIVLHLEMILASSSGLPITLACFLAFLSWATLVSKDKPGPIDALIAGIFMGGSALAMYGSATFLVAGFIYIILRERSKRCVVIALALLGGFLLSTSPWLLRNLSVTGRPWGTLRWVDLSTFTATHLGLQTIREFSPEPFSLKNFLLSNPIQVLNRVLRFSLDFSLDLPRRWSWIVLVLAFASWFKEGLPEKMKRLRSLTFLSLCIYIPFASLFAYGTDGLLLFFPPIALVAASLMIHLFQSTRTKTEVSFGMKNNLSSLGICVLCFLLIALPLLRSVFATQVPFPPLMDGDLRLLEDKIEKEAVVATDVPFALAWHCDRKTVWLPLGIGQLAALCEDREEIRYLYLSASILMYPGTENPDRWKQTYLQKSHVPGFQLDPRFSGFGVLYKRLDKEREPRMIGPDGE